MFENKVKLANKSRNIRNIVISLIIGVTVGITIDHSILNPLVSPNVQTVHSTKDERNISSTIIVEDSQDISISSIKIDTCFTPPSGCSKVITAIIDKASTSIYVQAYGFTDVDIADSLIAAHNRGVKVKILLDKSNLHSKYSKLSKIKSAGIDVLIDNVPGIAHNKVMIIDENIVITGSFNFSKNADYKNAENVIIINDPIVARQYLQNWLSREHVNNNLTKKD
ncbi:phospholipase [Rickettsia amblyommatis]|uniref:Phospholipase D n=2 Tax=Rickettsia amblyommatis TaxID=33989 RepID=H8K5K5_RICAG|nr:phospholipase D family protein [Rickettsia amblyommatis]AFC69799.1 phospholipase D superfamily protein PLD [Rickettsia amblyommatis str. GAT-30V]ARD88161.1 phospholipase [Rickettsia amblyommatis]KJV62242.1 PLD-like domain protein [Rickettsia amblyommatis str. Ac/Pa]KJV99999.1 PLD-like domain protein [Rickettsia amblyommatis str. Darkwater]